jgi:hypothetical protein
MQQRSQIPEADDKTTIQTLIKGLTPGPTASHLTRKNPRELMSFFINLKNTSYLTKIIVEESLNEMNRGKATEEQRGDLTFKTHETSIMWKTHSSIRTIGQAQEEVLHPREEEGEEDLRKFRIMIQRTHTSTANIMEEATTPKRAQRRKRT